MSIVDADTPCPHCGKLFNTRNFVRHVGICLSREDVRARVLAALQEPGEPTRAISKERYRARFTAFNIPGPMTLLRQYGGTWPGVCAAYGLEQPIPYRDGRPRTSLQMPAPTKRNHSGYALIPCPHCRTPIGCNKLPAHIRTCVDAPDIHAAIADALESDTPGVGITEAEYRLISHERGIPSRSTVIRRYGTWADVLAAFGLEYPQRDTPRTYTPEQLTPRLTLAQKEAAAIADVDAMSEAVRRELASDYEAEHTFTGYRVRDLPGVTVNGRPVVAVMLR